MRWLGHGRTNPNAPPAAVQISNQFQPWTAVYLWRYWVYSARKSTKVLSAGTAVIRGSIRRFVPIRPAGRAKCCFISAIYPRVVMLCIVISILSGGQADFYSSAETLRPNVSLKIIKSRYALCVISKLHYGCSLLRGWVCLWGLLPFRKRVPSCSLSIVSGT